MELDRLTLIGPRKRVKPKGRSDQNKGTMKEKKGHLKDLLK